MEKFAPVSQLIPQKPPFVMVDACTAHSAESTSSVFMVRDDNVLLQGGYLSAYGLIENMAQTAAIRSGLEAASNGDAAPVGFIGTITGTEIFDLPALGTKVETTAVQTTRLLNIIVIEAECKAEGHLLARSAMKIVLMDSSPDTSL